MTNKPTIHLPLNPSNYYGSASDLHNIAQMQDPPILYIGENRTAEEMRALSIKIEDGVYTIETDKAFLIGTQFTRVNLKSNHNINRKASQ